MLPSCQPFLIGGFEFGDLAESAEFLDIRFAVAEEGTRGGSLVTLEGVVNPGLGVMPRR